MNRGTTRGVFTDENYEVILMHENSSTVHRNNLGWCAALASFPGPVSGLGTRLVLWMAEMAHQSPYRTGVLFLLILICQNVPELVSKMCYINIHTCSPLLHQDASRQTLNSLVLGHADVQFTHTTAITFSSSTQVLAACLTINIYTAFSNRLPSAGEHC